MTNFRGFLFTLFVGLYFLSSIHAEDLRPCVVEALPTEVTTQGLFEASVWLGLPPEIQARVVGKSWKDHPLCPKFEDLAYMQVTHWNLEGEIAVGELVFHVKAAEQFVAVFKELFHIQFPIHKMVLVDDYNADDELSMEDNNSSCFCFRMNTTNPSNISNHALGIAVDLNPLFNPYINSRKGLLLPKTAEGYVDRASLLNVPGVIQQGDACYQLFIAQGFEWGGDWDDIKDGRTDYQHFALNPVQLGLLPSP